MLKDIDPSLDSSKVQFVGRCDYLKAEDLEGFDNSSRTVKFKTFARKVGASVVHTIDSHFGVPIRRDYHVSYAVGKWRGKPAVCMFHSAWHHIWTLKTPH